MFTAMTATLSEADKERVKSSFLNTPQKVLVSAMESMADESLYATDKINVPVLAILAKTPFWPADTEQFLRSLAPDMDIRCGKASITSCSWESQRSSTRQLSLFLTRKTC